MNWDVIEEEFDTSAIKKRRGAFGRVKYVGLNEYIKRLNKLFDYQWDFEIEQEEIVEGFAVVRGKLTGGGVTKTAYGTSMITLQKNTTKATQVGDDYKSAASDCLKKCASLFGIGLYLYEEPESKPEEETSEGEDNVAVLKHIAKGEAMIAEVSSNMGAAQLREHYSIVLEEATPEQLQEYYVKLIENYNAITTMESRDEVDA